MLLRSIQSTHRVLKNEAAERVAELEARGAAFEDFYTIIKGERGRRVMEDGELDAGLALCGLNVGLIEEIQTVQEVIEGMVDMARSALERLGSID